MSKSLLTDAYVRAARPTARGRAEYWDDAVAGFSLRVSQAGRKTWSVMYRFHGRLRRHTLGAYPALGLADARRKAATALHEVAMDVDPAAAKLQTRRGETFRELAVEYMERHAKFKKTGREDRRILYGSLHKKRTGKRPHTPVVESYRESGRAN